MMHTDLIAYQKSMDFIVEIYRITSLFPPEEKYGLVSQLRRGAVSIPTNISEGVSRNSTKEYIRFLYISLGSVSETECLLEISKRLRYYEAEKALNSELLVIKKMLLKLIGTLKGNDLGMGNAEII